jgi:hypothetical protein
MSSHGLFLHVHLFYTLSYPFNIPHICLSRLWDPEWSVTDMVSIRKQLISHLSCLLKRKLAAAFRLLVVSVWTSFAYGEYVVPDLQPYPFCGIRIDFHG